MVSHIEQILRNTPEVESTSRRTGLQLGLAAVTEANRGDFSVKLKRKRERGVEDVIAEVRAKVVKAEPLVDVEFPQVLQDMIGDLTSAPEPVKIKLFSQDPAQLETWAPKVAAALKKVPGVVDSKTASKTPSAARPSPSKSTPSPPPAPALPRRRSRSMPAPSFRANPPPRPSSSTTAPTPSACASRRAPRLAGCHSQHADHQQHRQSLPASAILATFSKFPAKPKSAAKTCSATSPSPPASKTSPLAKAWTASRRP